MVALIELEDGIRTISNLQRIDVADVRLGMPVELFFASVDGATLPQFRPVAGG